MKQYTGYYFPADAIRRANHPPPPDITHPERPVQVYSYWGNPSPSIGHDGDFVLEEITGTLIGPKENGQWPDEMVRIEGAALGRCGHFPRWKRAAETIASREGRWTHRVHLLRSLVASISAFWIREWRNEAVPNRVQERRQRQPFRDPPRL